MHLDGGVYWDGLFSQNPPIRELVDARPDEIWVIQINPTRVETEPTTWSRSPTGATSSPATCRCTRSCTSSRRSTSCSRRACSRRDGRYRTIIVRIIELSRSRALRRGSAPPPSSTATRRSSPSSSSTAQERAGEFLAALAFERAWAAGDVDATVGFLSDDARLESRAPFPEHAAVRGRKAVERFLRDHLVGATAIDVTRKQVAGERVTWSARWHPRDAPAPVRGVIEVVFDGDRVTSLRLVAP